MAYLWCEGYDTQILSAVGGGGATTNIIDRKWMDNATGNASVVWDSSTPIYGTASFEISGAQTVANYAQQTVNALPGVVAGITFRSPSGNTVSPNQIITFDGPGHILRLLTSTNRPILKISPAGSNDLGIFSPIANRLYYICVSVDVSANPHVFNIWAYDLTAGGTLITHLTTTFATAATTITSVRFGSNTTIAAGFNVDLDSAFFNDDLTTAPIPPMRVVTLHPNADGTHSFTLGDFQDNTSTNIAAAATTVNTLVSKPIPTSASFVKQAVSNTNSYVEVAFESLPSDGTIGTPVFVELKAAVHPVGNANANLSMFRLNDGGTITAESTADMSAATDTLEFHKHGYQVRPNGGGAWDTASVNALKSQYGFSTDISPQPALDALYIAALCPITLSPVRSLAQII